MRLLSAAAIVLTASVAGDAFAANKSLAAAKDNLPSDVDVVASVDLKGIRSTPLMSMILPIALSTAHVRDAVDKVKKDCGFDPVTAVDDVTVGVNDKNQGGVFVGMAITEAKFTSCVVALAKQEAGKDVTTTKNGNEIVFDTGGKKLFVMWLPGDVVAFAAHPDDEAGLNTALSGAGALKTAPIGAWLSQADPDAVTLAAVSRKVSQSMFTLSGALFSVTDKSGNIAAKCAVDLGSASDAELAAKSAGLLSGIVGRKNPPAEVDRLLKTLDVKASGSTVTAKVSTTESDLVRIIEWAMKGMP